jgi:glycosyltransferase involved in cell wall biosynthesis
VIGLAVILFWTLMGLIIGQGLLCLWFIGALLWLRWKPCNNVYCPKTAVILCLRGADPFLRRCVESLLAQDYPKYDIHIVIDSPEDPAWEVIREFVDLHQAVPIKVHTLIERQETCTLKLSSLLQTVAQLDASYEVVALVDADTIPHRSWLSELVAPLADKSIGASTGNRWYMPAQGTWGALVRYAWNAAAVVQMFCYRIPWGGTLALKTSVLRSSNLLERWKHAFCEDTMLYRALRKQRLRVAFVPSLMMINREACDVPGFVTFLKRQLLCARLYHPAWPAVVGHAIGISIVQVAALGVFLIAVMAGQRQAAAWTGWGMIIYWAAMLALLAMMEGCVRRIARRKGETTKWINAPTLLKIIPAILLTQFIYNKAMISMFFMRLIAWRGVHYEVRGPWQVRLVEYRPFGTDDGPGDVTASL